MPNSEPSGEAVGERHGAARVAGGDRELAVVLPAVVLGQQAAALLAGIREHARDIADRIDVLAAEALAPVSDTAAVRRRVEEQSEPSLRERGRRAQLEALEAADDPARALQLARSLKRKPRDIAAAIVEFAQSSYEAAAGLKLVARLLAILTVLTVFLSVSQAFAQAVVPANRAIFFSDSAVLAEQSLSAALRGAQAPAVGMVKELRTAD